MKRLLPLLLFFAASCSSDWWLGPHLMRLLSEPRIQASSITPITSLSSGAPTQLGGAVAGALYAQADRIDVLCTASGAVTLHLIEWSISGSRWSTQGATGCALDSASGPANATCRFIAKRQPTYWHVYKTGAGSVSNCLIEAVYAGAGLVLEAQAQASGATLPDLSPSPAGTYAYPASITANAKGLITSITAGSGGPSVYTTNVGDNGDSQVLGGTSGNSGRLLGYCRQITTSTGFTTGVSQLAAIWNVDDGAGVSVDTTGDTTGAAITYGSGQLEITSQPLVLGFTRVCKHWVITP